MKNTIHDFGEKCKETGRGLWARLKRREDAYIALLILAVSAGSFALGRFSVISENMPPVRYIPAGDGESIGAGLQSASVELVGSRGSDKYHYPWCPGGERIKEENRIVFSSEAEAQAAGYEPAKNCPGL